MDEREGKHREWVTKELVKVTPSFCICRTCGMYCTRFSARSSVRIKIMLGCLLEFVSGAAALAAGGAVPDPVEFVPAVEDPAPPPVRAFICPKSGFSARHSATTFESTFGNNLLALRRCGLPCTIGAMQSSISPLPLLAAPCANPAFSHALRICRHAPWPSADCVAQNVRHPSTSALSFAIPNDL